MTIISEDQPLSAVMKGDIHNQNLKFEARIWLDLGRLLFVLIVGQNTTIEGVFNLSTKRDKDAEGFKKLKLTMLLSASPLPKVLRDTSIPPLVDRPVSPLVSGLLKLAHIAHEHNVLLVNPDKAIPPMIQYAINIVMKPVVEKFSNLCGWVDVLEKEVDALRMEMERRKKMDLSMQIDLKVPIVVVASPIIDINPPDNWWVGYNLSSCAAVEEIHVSEQSSDGVIQNMDDSHHGDPYWTPPIYTYHKARTILGRWEVASPHLPLTLRQDPLMPSIADIALRNFS
ncbi:hypothetical protein HAX54_047316 [Datura stramonium]|uniref:Uncharacterized protein n=1 Tax=Datura stramonium TaxID=4076 RepID=A0ABS8STQ2_DATST|nr:hypothetical protein [Datura stramonium]